MSMRPWSLRTQLELAQVDGHTRATTLDPTGPDRTADPAGTRAGALEPLSALLSRRHADLPVAARPLTDYDTAAMNDRS
jgi:hypothetical protein